MRIEVDLYATLKRHLPSAIGSVISIVAPEGNRAADVIARVAVGADEVHILMINDVSSPLDPVLIEGNRLGLFPAVGGG